MLESTIVEDIGLKWVNLTGRIDSLTFPKVQQHLSELVESGERIIVVNLEGVNYVSSAGIRVFLMAQKQLRNAGGEIILLSAAERVKKVFETGMLHQLFFFADDRQQIESKLRLREACRTVSANIEGISFQYIRKHSPGSTVSIIGSQDSLPSAAYSERDVITVKAGDIRFGAGLATVGDRFEDYKMLFGESIVIDHSLFFLPAIKNPAVDYMIQTADDSAIEYKFLNGFGFRGALDLIASFEGIGSFVQLSGLVNAAFQLSESSVLGLVFLAESKGLYGMHLKKVPIAENKPSNGNDIFHARNFPDWINFPIEPGDFNSIVLGTGIALRDRGNAAPELLSLIPQGSNFHTHAALFSKEPLSRDIAHFEAEIRRVITEVEVQKVQHLLPQSLLGWGMLGIVELRG